MRNRMADSMDPDFVRMPSPAAFHPGQGGGPPPSHGPPHMGGYYDPSPVGPPQYDGYDPNGVDAYGYRDSYHAPPPHSHSYTDVGYGGGYGDGDGYGDGGGEFPALGVAGGHVPPIWAPPPPPPGLPRLARLSPRISRASLHANVVDARCREDPMDDWASFVTMPH